METMTSRERMMITLRNGQADRVPATPDISNMIPAILTGKPFWDVYINQDPPLWKAYIDAVRHFSMDGWFIYGDLQYKMKTSVQVDTMVTKKHERWEVRNVYRTPDGDLTECLIAPVADPPTLTEKKIKNFKEDFKKFRHLYSEIIGYNDGIFREQTKELGDLGIMCVCIMPPGIQNFIDWFDGSLEAATFAYYDYPELFMELCELHERQCLQMLEIAIEAGADSILTGGSGSLALQSPEIWRELSLPALKKITRMCREAGVISGIHSCGKERYIIEVCANETELDYINPLEIPPMGDCDLRECKSKFGHRLALMGNMHTTEVMLLGSPVDIKRESLKAILAAGEGGGFVLSTGDQCGRDTPEENILALVETAKEFGRYPLDVEKIKDELCLLKHKIEGI